MAVMILSTLAHRGSSDVARRAAEWRTRYKFQISNGSAVERTRGRADERTSGRAVGGATRAVGDDG